jgi:hypothetical protein
MTISFASFAQKYDLGVGLIYGDDIQSIGQNTRFYVNSADHRFCFGPEFSWFMEHEEKHGGATVKKNLVEFNLNGHVNFDIYGPLGFYPLIGLNYSMEREREFEEGELLQTENIHVIGLNLGTGLHLKLRGHWIMYLEYDHLFSELNQNTLTLGILKGFGEFKHKSSEERHH